MQWISCYVITSAKSQNILSSLSSLLCNLFRLYILWWLIYACAWGKDIWPIVFYRPTMHLETWPVYVVTSSLVVLQTEIRYASIENCASTYALMIFGLWVLKFMNGQISLAMWLGNKWIMSIILILILSL